MTPKELEQLDEALHNARVFLNVYMSEFDSITPVMMKQMDDAIALVKSKLGESENVKDIYKQLPHQIMP